MSQLIQLLKTKNLPHAIWYETSCLEQAYKETSLCIKHLKCQYHACDACQTCYQITHHRHVDILDIDKREENMMIKIDDIRTVIKFAQHTTGKQYQIVRIIPAHHMNVFAANALLKILEEPPSNTIFLLLACNRQGIPVTLLSRCLQIKEKNVVFDEPLKDELIQLLANYLTSNKNNKIDLGYFTKDQNLSHMLQCLRSLICDCLKNRLGFENSIVQIKQIANSYSQASLWRLLQLCEHYAVVLSKTNLNETNVLKDVQMTLDASCHKHDKKNH